MLVIIIMSMRQQLLALLCLIQHAKPFLHGRRIAPAAIAVAHLERTESSQSTSTLSSSTETDICTGFYVHIPYCRRRCRYCDFAIVPIGSDSNARQTDGFLLMDAQYRKALLQEIAELPHTTIKNDRKRALSSIYFGGGTPSLAPPETIKAVLDAIRKRFHVDDENVEITMEMDPGTFDEEQLRKLAGMGINRISLGVQALDDAVLEQIGRVHRVQDIYDAIQLLQRVFVDDHTKQQRNQQQTIKNTNNFSIDLISGLPGVSLAAWADTLETTVHTLQPNHISIYDLQIEKGTVFGKWYDDVDGSILTPTEASISSKPRLLLPSPDDCGYMYRYASGYLRNEGFEHYEISSYARDGKRSCHNQVYWGYDSEWFAIGLGSTSFLNHHRYARPRAMSDYIDWVRRQAAEPVWLQEVDSNSTMARQDPGRLADIVLTRLRTIDGLDTDWLKLAYGEEAVRAVLKGAQLALDLGLANIENQILSLKDPQGFLFSNSILSSIFVELPNTEE